MHISRLWLIGRAQVVDTDLPTSTATILKDVGVIQDLSLVSYSDIRWLVVIF